MQAIFFESRCDAIVFGIELAEQYEVWLRDRTSSSGGHFLLSSEELRRLPCLQAALPPMLETEAVVAQQSCGSLENDKSRGNRECSETGL